MEYKSEIIENDQYNLQVSRYIHLNPVKANMVDQPLEYKWSSYNDYLDADRDKIIDDEKILSYFKNKSRVLYMKYVESIVINLAPGDIQKRGSHFDLGMAIGLLIQSNQILPKDLDLNDFGFIGELSLNGKLKVNTFKVLF